MAHKVVVALVDDLDGDPAEETVEFTLDGTRYELDLSAGNATKLRDTLSAYVAAARKPGRPTRLRNSHNFPTAAPDKAQNQVIRGWAHAAGVEVSDRGRISAAVIEAYHHRT